MIASLRGPRQGDWSVTLRTYVTAAMLVVLLPLLGHAVLVTWHSYSSSRAWAERDLMGDAEHLAEDVDARLDVARAVMHLVSQSPAARRGDEAAVREHLETVRAAGLIRAAVVTDPQGEVVVAAGFQPGRAAPIAGPGVSDQLVAGRIEGERVLRAVLPVRSDDPRLARLEFAVSVGVLRGTQEGEATWHGHLTVVADRRGEVVWSAQPGMGAALVRQIHDPAATAGVVHDWVAPDGAVQTIGFARAPRSGLMVMVAQPTPHLYDRVPFGPLGAVAIAVGAALLSVVLARLGAVQITAAYQAALRGTRAAGVQIDEATRLGQELRSSRDRLFQAVGGIAVVELTRAPGRRWGEAELVASANIGALLDLAPGEVLTAERLMQNLTPEDRAALGATLAGVEGQASVFTRLVRAQRPGQRARHFNLVGMLSESAPDVAAQLLLTVQDVTAQKETELELQAQASRLRLATEIAGLGVWERDPNCATGNASERLWEIMGRAPEPELDMEMFLGLIHPDDRVRVEQAMRVRLPAETPQGGGRPGQLQYRIVRADGGIRHVRASRMFVDDPAGGRVVGVLIDETEAVMAQRALAASEARFRLAVDVAELGVFERYRDQHRNVGVWNERMWRIRGLAPRPEPMGYDELVAMIHPDDRARVVAAMGSRRADDEDGSSTYEFRIIRADGEERIIQSRSVRTYHPEDQAVSIVAINLDVTERRRAEQALRESAAQLELAVETAQLGFAQVDPATGRGMWNERLYAIYGLPARAGRPTLEEVLERVHPEDRATMLDDLARQRSAPDEQPVESSFRVVRPDGQERILQVRSVRRHHADGSDTVSTVTQDVTERRRAELALEESVAQFRLAVETAELGVAQMETATGRGTWNDRLFRIAGMEPRAESPPAREWLVLVHPQDRDRVRAAMEARLAGNAAARVETEFRIVRPDGQERLLHLRSVRLRRADGADMLTTVIQDVTEQRRAAQALEESAARLRLAVDTAELGFALRDAASGTGSWNDRLMRMFGLPPGGPAPTPEQMLTQVHPLDREMVRDALARQRTAEHGQVLECEFRILRTDGQERFLHARGQRLVRADGSETFSTVVQDATERRRAAQRLSESEARFRLAVETAGLGVAELNRATGAGAWNERLFRICGLEPHEGRPPFETVMAMAHPDDRPGVEASVAAQLAGRHGDVTEHGFRIRRPDGEERVLHVRSTLLSPPGEDSILLTVTQDVTERRRAERALEEAAARLHLAVETAELGVAQMDAATGEGTWSDRLFRIYGLEPRADRPGIEEWMQRVHPDDRERVRETMAAQRTRPVGETVEVEFRIVRPDGQERVVHVRSVMLRREDGSETLSTVTQDITERRRAERALADSEARLRLAVETAGLGVAERDLATGESRWNEQMCRILGVDAERPVFGLVASTAMIHPDDRPMIFAARAQHALAPDGFVSEYDFRMLRPDGGVRILHSRSVTLRGADGSARMLSVNQDVTDRRRAEQALAESEMRLRLATEGAGLGIWEYDIGSERAFWSDTMWRLRGMERPADEAAEVDILGRLVAEDQGVWPDVLRRLRQGEEQVRYEYRIRLPDGTMRHLSGMGQPVRDAAGEVVRIVGVTSDVTEQRQAVQSLADSELRLRLAVDAAGLGIWDFDKRADRTVWSDRMWEIRGMAPSASGPTREQTLESVLEEDRPALLQFWERIEAGAEDISYEYRVKRPDGAIRHVSGLGRLLRDAAGEVVRVVGVSADVTERRLAELKVAESELRLRLATDVTGLGIWDHDPVAGGTFWNEQMFRLRGLAPMGEMPDRDFIASHTVEQDRATLLEAWDSLKDGRASLGFEYRVVWPDGTVRWLHSEGRSLYDAQGRVIRMVGVVMDVTEKRESELALLDRNTTLELALEAADLGIWTREPGAETRMASARVWAMLGHPGREGPMTREELMACLHPDDRAAVQRDWVPADGAPAPRQREFRAVWPDGTVHHFQSRRAVMRDAAGRTLRVIGLIADVTEARRAAAALMASEARLRLAVEAAELGIFDYDPDTREGTWSERTWRMRGLEPREGIPSLEEVAASVHPDDREASAAKAQLQFSGQDGTRIDNEFRVVWPDGTVRHLLLRAVLHRGEDGRGRVFGINMDVTERRAAALALEASEARLRLAVETAELGVFDVDPATEAGDWSDRMWRMRGLEPWGRKPSQDEALAMVHPDDRERFAAGVRRQEMLPDGAAGELEYRVVWPDGSVRHLHARAITHRDARGRLQRIFGINMDVTERRAAALALEASEARLRLAVETAELGVFEHDPATRLSYWSERIWRMRGLEPQEVALPHEEMLALVHPEDRERLVAHIERLGTLPDGGVAAIEYRVVRPDGDVRHLVGRTMTLRGRDGAGMRFHGINLDVTESRRAALALEESEARLRLAVETAGLGVFDVDPVTREGVWSERMWRMRGLEPRQGKPGYDEALALVHPEDRERVLAHAREQAELADGAVSEFEVRFIWPDGAVRYIQSRSIARRSVDGKVRRIFGVNLDITEQVERERVLRETAARYELAVDAAELGVFEFDPESRTGYWSDRIWLMRGLEPRPGTLSYPEVIDLVHPADRDDVAARMRAQFAGPDGMRGEYEFRIVRPDGTVRYIQSRAVTQRRPDGGLHRLFGVNLDITERRLAAQAMEESEARLRLASEAAELGIFQVNMPDGTGYWSDRMWRIRGMEPQPGLPGSQKAVATVHPDDRAMVRGMREAARTWPHGEVVRQQFRVVWPGGEVRHVASHAIILRGREEGAFSLIGVNVDITEQVVREQALRETAARFELAIDAARLAVWDWDPATERMTWSHSLWDMMGIAPSDEVPSLETRQKGLHPADRDRAPMTWIRSVTEGNEGRGEDEFRIVRRDGSIRYIHWQGIPLRDQGGGIVRLAGVAADVTEARLSELALRSSEELFRMAAEAAEQGVWDHDLATGAVTWSARLWRIHGLPPQEGAPEKEARAAFIHPEDRPEILGLADELLAAGANAVSRRSYRILRADGAVRTVERQAMLMPGPDGQPSRIVGVVHDVTEARELAAQTMVADKLATLGEMAGAIAHELAQPLQAVMATAATARMRLTQAADAATVERVSDRLAWIERQT